MQGKKLYKGPRVLGHFRYHMFLLKHVFLTSFGKIILEKLTSFSSIAFAGIRLCIIIMYIMLEEVENQRKWWFFSKNLHRDDRLTFYSVNSINFTLNSTAGWKRNKWHHLLSTTCLVMHQDIIAFISFNLLSNTPHHLHFT